MPEVNHYKRIVLEVLVYQPCADPGKVLEALKDTAETANKISGGAVVIETAKIIDAEEYESES